MKSDIEKLIQLMDNRQLLRFYINDSTGVADNTRELLRTQFTERGYGEKQVKRYIQSGLADEDIPLSMAAEEEAEQESFVGTGSWLGAWLFAALGVFLLNVAHGIHQLDVHLFPALGGLIYVPITLALYILFLREHRWFPKILMIILGLMVIVQLVELIGETLELLEWESPEQEYFLDQNTRVVLNIIPGIIMILYFGFSKHVKRYFHR
jgi:hypothetical protein